MATDMVGRRRDAGIQSSRFDYWAESDVRAEEVGIGFDSHSHMVLKLPLIQGYKTKLLGLLNQAER